MIGFLGTLNMTKQDNINRIIMYVIMFQQSIHLVKVNSQIKTALQKSAG